MNYEKINWTTGEKTREGYVIIDGVTYQTVQPEYTGETPVNVENLNHMDEGIYEVSKADYVTEIGEQTAGGVEWSYTKWKSGKVELTGSKTYSGMSITSQSAGTYYGGSETATLPFALSSVRFIGAQETSPRGSGIYVYSVSISGTTLTTDFRAHASSTNAGSGVNYYIIGDL